MFRQATANSSECPRHLANLRHSSILAENCNPAVLLLMIQILHYLKNSKLWELWYIPYYE